MFDIDSGDGGWHVMVSKFGSPDELYIEALHESRGERDGAVLRKQSCLSPCCSCVNRGKVFGCSCLSVCFVVIYHGIDEFGAPHAFPPFAMCRSYRRGTFFKPPEAEEQSAGTEARDTGLGPPYGRLAGGILALQLGKPRYLGCDPFASYPILHRLSETGDL